MIILLSYNHRINVYCVKYMYIIYVCKHNAVSQKFNYPNISII